MVLSFLKSSTAPIAIDFGYSELKVVQLAPGPDRPALVAAARVEVPEVHRADPTARSEFLHENLPRVIRDGRFRGRTAICSIPGWQTFVQHMQITKSEALDPELQIKERLQSVIACDPESVVIRHVEVKDIFRGGDAQLEVICFAVNRDVVIRQVELLNRCRLEIGGLHAEPIAAIRAFDHLYRRAGDENLTTLYVDIGANATKAMIAHGKELKFARLVPIGGRQFDQQVAQTLGCEVVAGRLHRIADATRRRATPSVTSTGGNTAARAQPALAIGANGQPLPQSAPAAISEHERRLGQTPREFEAVPSNTESAASDSTIRDTVLAFVPQLADELRMCLRYHEALFPGRTINRMILLGGESRDPEIARALAQAIKAPAFVGDPLKRVERTGEERLVGVEDVNGQPGWSVAAGLCNCPLDR